MNKTIVFLLGGAGVCLLAFVTYRSFVRPTEEEKVRRVLHVMERAAEQKELLKILSHVSNDYEDDMGFDKGALTQIGHEIFKTYDRIFVHLKDVSVQVKGKEAQARLTAVVSIASFICVAVPCI